jgi:hypothetical protein
MTDKDREWLRWLGKDLGEWVITTNSWWREKRRLTAEEWDRLTTLFNTSKELVFSLWTEHGFTLSLTAYEEAECPGAPPEYMISFNQRQIPEVEGIHVKPDHSTYVSDWNRAWKLLTKWTHSDRNIERLKANGLPEAKESRYYQY